MSNRTQLVQIAGVGLVTPFAWGRDASWSLLKSQQSATKPVSLPYKRLNQNVDSPQLVTVGAPLPATSDKVPQQIFELPSTSGLHLTKSQSALLFAVNEAWHEARETLATISPRRIGCVIGSSKGDWQNLQIGLELNGFSSIKNETRHKVHELSLNSGWPHTMGSLVSHVFNLRGPMLTPVAACATGLLTIVRGVELIQHGDCDAVVVGSVDCSLVPVFVASFRKLGVLNEDFIHPDQALKPFDIHRKGFVIGEGSGALILIRADLCQESSNHYGYWRGHHQLAEGQDTVKMTPNSPTLPRLLELTLERSNLTPQDIPYVNLHGTGTRMNDWTESVAVSKVLGVNPDYVCSSFKGGMGHLLGAAGLVETALSLLAMRDGEIPATQNCLSVDPEIKLPLITHQNLRGDLSRILKLSAGFGGHVIAAVIDKKRY